MSADYFSAGSLDYVRYRPRYPAPWFNWLVSQCAGRNLAWDCACGSGQATEELAKRFCRVIGTDASEGQLRNAPMIPNVEWRLGRGAECGLVAGCVDLVTVAQALHWFDLARFWAECHQVLKPSGIVAVWGYRTATLRHEAANGIFQDFYHSVLAGFWPKERRMLEEGYAKISFPFEELAVPDFEMVQKWDAGQIAGYCASWSATDRYRKEKGRDPIPELREKLGQELGEELVEIRWPFFARVGRVFHVEQNAG